MSRNKLELWQKKSASPEETFGLARDLAKVLKEGRFSLIGLEGDLGAGKTVFVRGLVEGLGGDPSTVSSPTFVIMQAYDTPDGKVYHFDWYRLGGPEELTDFGWFDLVSQKEGIIVVEWADKFRDYLPEDTVWVNIKHQGPSERAVEISFPGSSIG